MSSVGRRGCDKVKLMQDWGRFAGVRVWCWGAGVHRVGCKILRRVVVGKGGCWMGVNSVGVCHLLGR